MFDKLELGCGKSPLPGYLHQDIEQQDGVALDFHCPAWEMDIAPGSLSEVIALAVIEHLRFSEASKTLKHIYEILKPEGVFLFDVPDMRIWSEYLFNLTHGRQDLNPFPKEHVWAAVYGWQRWQGDEHKSGWVREDILELVHQSGFSDVIEGPDIFIQKGITRKRFSNPQDAHIYLKAIK